MNMKESHGAEPPIADEAPLLSDGDTTTPPPPSSSSNTSTPPRRGRKPRPAPKSQAKRRLEAMATSVDHKLATAFTIILVLYALITFGTWMSLEGQHYRSEVIELTKAQPLTKPRWTAAKNTAKEQQQQQQQKQQQQQQKPEQEVQFVKHNSANEALAAAGTAADYAAPAAGGAVENTAAAASVIQDHHPVRAEDIADISTLQHTFPIHASHDLEFIDHPGIFLATPESMKSILREHPTLPADGKMAVPKFWKPKCYGPKGVRYFLGNHGDELITPEQAAQIGSYSKEGLETIFVSVASYRDPECQPTIEDIFARADHPERIRVGIVDQRVEEDTSVPPCGQPIVPCDQDPEQYMCKYAHLIDVHEVDAILSVGPVFARHLANRMYRGEYFAMQVDSHVRFVEHWDTSLLDQWKSADNEMAVLTTYLSDITDSIDPVTHAGIHPGRPIMCKTEYEGSGKLKHLRHGQQPEGPAGIHGEPTLHPFWAAGFSFARGHFVVQVPYDQFEPMVFQGEEIFMGLRGWSYGYDYYAPEISIAFHMYAIKKNKSKRKKVKLFWENSNLYPGSAVEGMKRLNGIIGTGDPGDTYYDADELEYGLGKVRPKEQLYRLYGIHTETKTVEDHLCSYVGKYLHNLFKPHLRKNRMGIDFSEIKFEYKDPNPPAKSEDSKKKRNHKKG